MGLFDRILGKKKQKDVQTAQTTDSSSTLADDIISMSEWVVTALNSSGYNADYSLESMKEIDRFFDEQSGENGILSTNRGQIIFGLASYIGQTIIKICGGEWVTNDDDPEGEINISVKLPDGGIIFPVQRCLKRYTNGAEDGIYAYAYVLVHSNESK